MNPVAAGLAFVFWLLMMIGMIGGYIFLIVAFWKGMKAHESMAESLKQIASRTPAA
ncbi:MAG: hypothetical protein ABII00_06235 [Elusimicrobiota bacterium]